MELNDYLLWYSLTSLLALPYLISRLSDWLWASASRWLTTLHSVWASCQYLINTERLLKQQEVTYSKISDSKTVHWLVVMMISTKRLFYGNLR